MVSQGTRFRYLFKSAENLANREYSRLLEPFGVTPNQSEVLIVLGKYAPLSLKTLGEILICEEKSPSRLVQSLIKKGLVAKKISDKDKRSTLLSLTAKGRQLLPKIMELEQEFDQSLSQQIMEIEAFSQSLKNYVAGSFYEKKMKNRHLWKEEE